MRAVEYPAVPRRWWFMAKARPVAMVLAAAWFASPAWAEQRPFPSSSAGEMASADGDGSLAQLTGSDAAARKAALAALESGNSTMLPGLAKRLADLKRTANRD